MSLKYNSAQGAALGAFFTFEQKSSNEPSEYPYFPKEASNVLQQTACYPSLEGLFNEKNNI